MDFRKEGLNADRNEGTFSGQLAIAEVSATCFDGGLHTLQKFCWNTSAVWQTSLPKCSRNLCQVGSHVMSDMSEIGDAEVGFGMAMEMVCISCGVGPVRNESQTLQVFHLQCICGKKQFDLPGCCVTLHQSQRVGTAPIASR